MKLRCVLSVVLCCVVLCCVMLCCVMLCGAMPVSAEEAGTIAAFSFSNEGAVVENNIEENGYGDKDKGYNSTAGDAELYASVNGTSYRKLEWTKDDYSGVGIQPAMTGGRNNPWAEGAYLEVQVSTVGFQDITFSAKIGGTKKGPRDYQLQYSVDGTTYHNVGDQVMLTENKTMTALFDGVALPADAAGAEMLYIRIAVASDQTIGGEVTLYGSTGGETAINDIVVGGTVAPGATVTTVSPDQTAAQTPAATTINTTAPDGAQGGNDWLVWVLVGVGVAAVAVIVTAVVVRNKKRG